MQDDALGGGRCEHKCLAFLPMRTGGVGAWSDSAWVSRRGELRAWPDGRVGGHGDEEG